MDRDLKILISIKGARAVKEVRGVRTELDKAKGSAQRFGGSINKAENKVHQFRISTSAARRSIGAIRNELLVLAFAFGGVAKAISGSIDAFKKYQAAMIGLSSIGKAVGIAQNDVKDAAISLADDGLMTVSEAAAGLKNLLATHNYTLKQSVDIMKSFKDWAAFNRQGMLGFGEAIERSTQGLKNELAMLTDNVGWTTNLIDARKKYAKEIGTTVGKMDEAQRYMAYYTVLMRESTLVTGNASKFTEIYSGKLSQLHAITRSMKISLGEVFTQGLKPIIGALKESFVEIKKNIDANKELIKLKVGDFFKSAYTGTKLFVGGVSSVVGVLFKLRVALKAVFAIWAGGKIWSLAYAIYGKLATKIGAVIKAYRSMIAAQTALQISVAASNRMSIKSIYLLGQAKVATDAFTKAIMLQKLAVWGVIAVVAALGYAIYRLATHEERARKERMKGIAVDIDKKNADIELMKSKLRVAKATKDEIEEMKESGRITDVLKDRLKDVRKEIDSLNTTIGQMEIDVLVNKFNLATEEVTKTSLESAQWLEIVEAMGNPLKQGAEGIGVFAESLGELRKSYNEMEKTRLKDVTYLNPLPGLMGESIYSTKQVEEQVRATTQMESKMLKAETVLYMLKEALTKTGKSTKDLKKDVEDLTKAYLNMQKRIRTTTQSMLVDILKFKGMETDAARKQLGFEIKERKILAVSAKALGVDTTKFLTTLNKWAAWKSIDIDRKMWKERVDKSKAALKEIENVNKKIIESVTKNLSEGKSREENISLLNVGSESRDKMEVMRRAKKMQDNIKKSEANLYDDVLLIYIQYLDAKDAQDKIGVEKYKGILHQLKELHVSNAKQRLEVDKWLQGELWRIENDWMFKLSEAMIQSAQDTGQTLGFQWFQNEKDTQDQIKRIRDDYRVGNIKSEVEMQRKIALARKNAEIRSANATLKLYQSVVNNVGQMFMAMIQRQITLAETTADLIKLSFLGIGVGVVTSLLSAFIGSKQKQEEQFLSDTIASTEKQRRTSFGRLAQAPVMNISIVPTVSIAGDIVNIGTGGDISSFETGMEELIKKTIQDSIDTGEIDFGNLLTSGAEG